MSVASFESLEDGLVAGLTSYLVGAEAEDGDFVAGVEGDG